MEKVLCLIKDLIPKVWIKKEVSLKIDLTELQNIANSKIKWLTRQNAETNLDFKQAIVYAIVKNKDKRACYPRSGSENRLHGLWSIGVGGHINPDDQEKQCFIKTLKNGLRRELKEEFIDFNLDKATIAFHGIINEEYSDVGNVHIGFVFEVIVEKQLLPAEELQGLKWIKKEEISNYNLELWSKLAFKLIKEK